MDNKLKKKLRAIGHGLNPVVTIAGNGLSDGVMAELNRALDDHELIKIKVVAERDERADIVKAVGLLPSTTIVQTIGGVALVYRPAKEPDPALSNIARSGLL